MGTGDDPKKIAVINEPIKILQYFYKCIKIIHKNEKESYRVPELYWRP